MRSSRVRLLVAAAGLVSATSATALTMEDCQRWMGALGEEVGEADITDDDDATARRELRDSVDAAAREGRTRNLDRSRDNVRRFKERAAVLAEEQKVSGTQADRFDNLSEAVARCLAHVDEDVEEEEQEEAP